MILYLQKNYDGTFTVCCKDFWEQNVYVSLIEDIPGDIHYKDLVNFLVRDFGCKKLVLDF